MCTQVGKIVKIWAGLGKELFTDADTFKVEFPPGIDAAAKARLLGTVFFINIQFFEKGADGGGGAPPTVETATR